MFLTNRKLEVLIGAFAIALIALLLGGTAHCQTTTTIVYGTIKGLDQVTVTSGKVIFTLKPSVDTTMSGSGRFTPTSVLCKIGTTPPPNPPTPPGNNLWNATITGPCTLTKNTSLTPAGTYYQVDICPYNACTSKMNFFAYADSMDFSTLVPTPASVPAYPTTQAAIVSGTIDGVTIGSNSPVSITARSFNGILNASEYETIDAAIAALDSNGGEVYVPAGTYPCPVNTITKPIILHGAGAGGYANNLYTQLAGATILTDDSQTATCVVLGTNASSAYPGAVISHLQIRGNRDVPGATTGSGIKLLGGTSTSTAFRNVVIEDVFIWKAKENCVDIRDNAYMVELRNVHGTGCGGNGLYIGRTSGTGVPSQIKDYGSVFDMNAGDGIEIGVGVGDVYKYGGTLSNSGGWGVHTVVGSGSAFKGYGLHLETNTSGGIWFQGGGGGHLIDGGWCSGNTICIKVDTEASNSSQSSADLQSIYSETDSIVLTANAKNTCVKTSTSATPVTDNGVNTGCRTRGLLSATTMLANNHTFVDSGDTTAGRPFQQRFGNVLLYKSDGTTISHRFNNDGSFEAASITPVTFFSTPVPLGTSGTVSMDLAAGRQFTITPSNAVTLNATNCTSSQQATLVVLTSGASSYNITFNTNFKSTGVLATGTTTGKYFTVRFECSGTTAYEISRTAAM